ncbi:MAG: hypothetical protein HN742_21725 [Lentisphaerae bacterium]|nr:hypothetical protein [Lentisphaerota bacterium]MBT5607082.1 hypothetical protein [Lentisphaerota bacterium]MBT7057189.1 hypothetical protein [Lentisphaerota bacterium]MBT7844512.1 hypothetical protein [Lentisphaerota bacterium]
MIASGAGIMAVLMMLGGNRQLLWVVLIGLAIVALLLALFRMVIKWRKRRKGEALTKSIQASTSTAGLRQRFDEGIAKFKQAGKDLYSVPWFLVAGESGSGKTELIRRSQLRFPPGLQDYLQGMGGTRDMHWWFTSEAVVIDTAGRMFVSDADGSTSEEDRHLWDRQWHEFLRLLNTSRKQCPINGLILVLPVDKLIQDSAEELERKGREIAGQFDVLQRSLDIRFPVSIIITKCDLLLGFREFFEHIDDPVLQHQMLGWSNPASLDEAFDARTLDGCFSPLVDKVRARSLSLMQDPHPVQPGSNRLSEVDSLYAFGDSLGKVVPRLSRYLETIFAGGEWSPKPLFLRGIYLNSSMREGSAIDADLADALGMSVDSLPEGRVWEKERAFFIRDVLTEKVFREGRLVTRASNAQRQYRNRQAGLLAAGFACVFLLAGLTWYGQRTFKDSIGTHSEYWRAAADEGNWTGEGETAYFSPVVVPEMKGGTTYLYNDQSTIGVAAGATLSASHFHSRLHQLVAVPIRIPRVFFAARMGMDLDASRADAYRLLVERSILAPLLDATESKLAAATAEDWSVDGARVLGEMVRTEARARGLGGAVAEAPPTTSLELWLAYVLNRSGGGAGWDCFMNDAQSARLQDVVDAVYSDPGQWPPSFLRGHIDPHNGVLDDNPALEHAFGLFFAHECGLGAIGRRDADGTVSTLRRLEALKVACEELDEAERKLLELDDEHVGGSSFESTLKRFTIDEFEDVYKKWHSTYAKTMAGRMQSMGPESFDSFVASWREAYARYADKHGALNELAGAITLPQDGAVADLYESAVRDGTEGTGAAGRVCAGLGFTLSAIPPGKKGGELTPSQRDFMAFMEGRSASALKQTQDHLLEEKRVAAFASIDVNYMAALRQESATSTRDRRRLTKLGDGTRLYQLRALIYRIADKALGDPAAVPDVREELKKLLALAPDRPMCAEAVDLATFASSLATAKRNYTQTQERIHGLRTSMADVVAFVRKEGAADVPLLPTVPFTGLQGEPCDASFVPSGAKRAFEEWASSGELIKGSENLVLGGGELSKAYAAADQAYREYLEAYLDYWCQRVPLQAENVAKLRWTAEDLQPFKLSQPWHVRKAIEDLTRLLEDAISSAAPILGDDDLPPHVSSLRARIAATRGLFGANGGNELAAGSAFAEQCRKAWTSWAGLSDDTLSARRELLLLEPAKFLSTFFVIDPSARPNLAIPFWSKLTTELLSSLARETATLSSDAIGELNSRRRFPLARPVSGTPALSSDDIVSVQKMIERTRPGSELYPAGAIGAGGRTGVSRVDTGLEQLHRPPLNENDRRWIEAAYEVLRPFSGRQKVLTCTASVSGVGAAGAPANTSHVYEMWRVVELSQGTRSLGKSRTDRGQDQVLGKIEYPGEPVVLKFYRYLDDQTPARVISIAGPWACLRLLFAGPLEGSGDVSSHSVWGPSDRREGGAVWTCPLAVRDDEGVSRGMALKLEFSHELPNLSDWP